MIIKGLVGTRNGLIGERSSNTVEIKHDVIFAPINSDVGVTMMTFADAEKYGVVKKIGEEDQNGLPFMSWEVEDGTPFLKSVTISIGSRTDQYAVPLLAMSNAPRYCYGINMFSIEETVFDGNVHVLTQPVLDSMGILCTAPKATTLSYLYGVKVENGSPIRTATLRRAINTEIMLDQYIPVVEMNSNRFIEF